MNCWRTLLMRPYSSQRRAAGCHRQLPFPGDSCRYFQIVWAAECELASLFPPSEILGRHHAPGLKWPWRGGHLWTRGSLNSFRGERVVMEWNIEGCRELFMYLGTLMEHHALQRSFIPPQPTFIFWPKPLNPSSPVLCSLPHPPPHCALSSPRSTVYLQCSIRGTLRFPARVWLAEGSTFCERLVLRRLSLASVLHIRSIAPWGSDEPILCPPNCIQVQRADSWVARVIWDHSEALCSAFYITTASVQVNGTAAEDKNKYNVMLRFRSLCLSVTLGWFQ